MFIGLHGQLDKKKIKAKHFFNKTPLPLQLYSVSIHSTSVANWYIHIYNKFENLVYFQCVWYMSFCFGIYKNFGIVLVYFCWRNWLSL